MDDHNAPSDLGDRVLAEIEDALARVDALKEESPAEACALLDVIIWSAAPNSPYADRAEVLRTQEVWDTSTVEQYLGIVRAFETRIQQGRSWDPLPSFPYTASQKAKDRERIAKVRETDPAEARRLEDESGPLNAKSALGPSEIAMQRALEEHRSRD